MTSTVSSTTVSQQPGVAPSIDIESIPNQIGTAILNSHDWLSSSSSDNEEKSSITNHIHSITGNLSENDVGIIFRMLLQAGTFLSFATKDDDDDSNEHLKQICIDFPEVRYRCCLAKDGNLYIVKQTI